MPDGPIKLDEQLCFALYAATNAVTRAYRPLLDAFGLTYPQYLVLMVLWQHGDSTPGQVARRLNLAPNAITPLADRLEQAKLLTRQRGDADRRVIRLALTEKGRDLEAAIVRVQANIACQTGLPPDELTALRDRLIALVRRMEPEATAPMN